MDDFQKIEFLSTLVKKPKLGFALNVAISDQSGCFCPHTLNAISLGAFELVQRLRYSGKYEIFFRVGVGRAGAENWESSNVLVCLGVK